MYLKKNIFLHVSDNPLSLSLVVVAMLMYLTVISLGFLLFHGYFYFFLVKIKIYRFFLWVSFTRLQNTWHAFVFLFFIKVSIDCFWQIFFELFILLFMIVNHEFYITIVFYFLYRIEVRRVVAFIKFLRVAWPSDNDKRINH